MATDALPPAGDAAAISPTAAGKREGWRAVVCRLEELPPGATRIVQVGGREIGVFNVAGRIYAVRNSCPHRAAPLCQGRLSGTPLPSDPYEYNYGRAGLVLRCPWHGWEFDLETGEPLVAHGLRARTYHATVVDGEVVLSG